MFSRVAISIALLISVTLSPSMMGRHNGRVILMGHYVLVFDDQRILFHAGMLSGDFFDRLERRKTADSELFFMDSKPITNYPESVTVKLFGNQLKSDDTAVDKRCPGAAAALMNSLQFKAEWKSGLNVRPVSKMAVRSLRKEEMAPSPSLWAYELDISSAGVPLTDHLIVSVYGADSSLVARFSAAP